MTLVSWWPVNRPANSTSCRNARCQLKCNVLTIPQKRFGTGRRYTSLAIRKRRYIVAYCYFNTISLILLSATSLSDKYSNSAIPWWEVGVIEPLAADSWIWFDVWGLTVSLDAIRPTVAKQLLLLSFSYPNTFFSTCADMQRAAKHCHRWLTQIFPKTSYASCSLRL